MFKNYCWHQYSLSEYFIKYDYRNGIILNTIMRNDYFLITDCEMITKLNAIKDRTHRLLCEEPLLSFGVEFIDSLYLYCH